MDEALLVREAESAGDLQRKLDRVPLAQRPLAFDQRLQVLAVDVLEDDVLAAVLLAAVDHRDDVRVRELRHGPGFAPEALDLLAVGEKSLVEHLERHVALEQPVVSAIDARHAPCAHELFQLVALRDQLADHDRHSARATSR